jgi:hypothetical protein
MKIGYSVEGGTDRALLQGLKRRWCREAELIPGQFRGTSGQSQRREIPNTCIELSAKGADVIIFLRDANAEDWREVLKSDQARCRAEHSHIVVFGVCARNVECWLCRDVHWIAAQTQRDPRHFQSEDPKGVFESALGITRTEKKEDEIANLVECAPLQNWLANESFENFYDTLWQKSKQFTGCQLENLRESSRS